MGFPNPFCYAQLGSFLLSPLSIAPSPWPYSELTSTRKSRTNPTLYRGNDLSNTGMPNLWVSPKTLYYYLSPQESLPHSRTQKNIPLAKLFNLLHLLPRG
ncbi:hypothetical protein TNCV_612561 [Trichonephila clavipes]|nr:hypothetical protein TNCV_612561 [Trichonephila clavipes]